MTHIHAERRKLSKNLVDVLFKILMIKLVKNEKF